MGKQHNNKYYIIRMGGGHIVLYYDIVLPTPLYLHVLKKETVDK